MTVRILKPAAPKRKYTGTCIHCLTVVEFDEEDGSPSPDPRDTGNERSIPCPTPRCGATIWGTP